MVCFWYCFELGGNITSEIEDIQSYATGQYGILEPYRDVENKLQDSNYTRVTSSTSRHRSTARPPAAPHSLSSYKSKGRKGYFPTSGHQCDHFAFPPPPPADRRRTGPRRKFRFFHFGLLLNS